MSQAVGITKKRHVSLVEAWDKEHAVVVAREYAAAIGFSMTDRALIATAVSELSTNILRYAGRGEILLSTIRQKDRVGIEVVAVDHGPGISDIESAVEEHYSTTTGSLGLGLPAVRRIMDKFLIESSAETGTRVSARKWRDHEAS